MELGSSDGRENTEYNKDCLLSLQHYDKENIWTPWSVWESYCTLPTHLMNMLNFYCLMAWSDRARVAPELGIRVTCG